MQAPTRVDLGARARAKPASSAADDSLAAVAGVPGRGSRRVLVAAAALAVLALGAASVLKLRALRQQGATPPSVAAQASATVATGRSAPLGAVPSPPSAPRPDEPPTISVQSLPTAADPAAALPASQLPKTPKGAPSAAAAGRPRAGASPATPPVSGSADPATTAPEPAPTPGAALPSCDPPYWYDSNGNKRYYRHCVGR